MVVVSNLPPPSQGIIHEEPRTKAFVNGSELGKGTIFIAESRVTWLNSDTGNGFSIEYPHICVHAVSTDLESFPEECLYVMLDTEIPMGEGIATRESQPEDGESGDEDSSGMTEFRFVPEDKSVLSRMYSAMCQCQSLYPDPAASDGTESEEDVEGEFDDGDDEGYENGDGPTRFNGTSHIGMEVDGQFDDADNPHE